MLLRNEAASADGAKRSGVENADDQGLALAGNSWRRVVFASGRHALSVKVVSMAAATISSIFVYATFAFLDAYWREQHASGNSPVSFNATQATPFSNASIRAPLQSNGLLWGLLGILSAYTVLVGVFVFLGPLLVTLRLHLLKFKMCGLALLLPALLPVVWAANLLLVGRPPGRAARRAELLTSFAYIGFATLLIATVGRCIISPMRSQLRGYILRPLLVAFVSLTATQGVAAIGSSFLLPWFASASRFERVIIRLIVFPLISEAILTAVRLVCRVSFTPSLASQYTIMWLTPPLLATSLLGRLLATNLSSLGEAIALAIMIALIERGMRFTMPSRDFAAEQCLKACNWGQARGRARDALPDMAAAQSQADSGAGTPMIAIHEQNQQVQAGDTAQDFFLPSVHQHAAPVAPMMPLAAHVNQPENSASAVAAGASSGAAVVGAQRGESDINDPTMPITASGRDSSMHLVELHPRDESLRSELSATGSAASASDSPEFSSAAAAASDAHHLPSQPPYASSTARHGSKQKRTSAEASLLAVDALKDRSAGDPGSRGHSMTSVPSWTNGSMSGGVVAFRGDRASPVFARGDAASETPSLTPQAAGDASPSNTAHSRGSMPPLHPSVHSPASSATANTNGSSEPSPMHARSPASSHAAPTEGARLTIATSVPMVNIPARPIRSADAQVQVADEDGGSSSMPLWKVWHTRRWNHFQNAYLEVDTLSEDVGIMVSLPLALLFRLPPEPGALPLSAEAVVLRVVLQLVIELLTELAPVMVMLLMRACSTIPAQPVSASYLARKVLKLPALRNAEIISTPTGIQLRLQDTPGTGGRKRGAPRKRKSPNAAMPVLLGTVAAKRAAKNRTKIGARSAASTSQRVAPLLEPLQIEDDDAAGVPASEKKAAGPSLWAEAARDVTEVQPASDTPAEQSPSVEAHAATRTQSMDMHDHIELAGPSARVESPQPEPLSGGGQVSEAASHVEGVAQSSQGVELPNASDDSVLTAGTSATPRTVATPGKTKRMLFGFGRRASRAAGMDKSFSPAAAAAWYLTSPHPNRRRSSAGSASTAFSAFGPLNCCERNCPAYAAACDDIHCGCHELRACWSQVTCRNMCACSCLPEHLRRVVCHGPNCSSMESQKGESCCCSRTPRNASNCCVSLLKAPMFMFLARSWRLFLGCCLTPWDRAVLRESSIALRRIWAEDMAVERASLWQPFKLTTVTVQYMTHHANESSMNRCVRPSETCLMTLTLR